MSFQPKITLKINIWRCATLLLFSFSANTNAVAEQSVAIPLTFEYESNPTLSSTNEQPVSRFVLVPDYSVLINQGTEQWVAKASVRFERSSDQAISQDRNDPSLNLGWTHNYETGQFGLTTLLNEQSTRVSEVTDSGLLSGDNTRKTRALSANWLNSLSERASLNLNSSVTKVEFDGLVTAGLVNFRNESFDTSFNYTLSEQTEVSTQLFYSRYKPEGANVLNSETQGFNLGITWNVNEKFNMDVSAGTNEVKSTTRTKSWQAALNMQYTTQRTNSQFSLSRSLSPGSTGSINESNQMIAGWSYNLSEKEELIFSGRWGQNLSPSTIETKSLEAKYTRQISLLWNFSLSGIHRNRDDAATSVSSNSIMAGLIYNLSDF